MARRQSGVHPAEKTGCECLSIAYLVMEGDVNLTINQPTNQPEYSNKIADVDKDNNREMLRRLIFPYRSTFSSPKDRTSGIV